MRLLRVFTRANTGAQPADELQSRQSPRKLLARDRMDARHQEDDVALWRDYHAFLKSRQSLLDIRAAEAHGAFEQTEALEANARQAQARLDSIPAGLRAMFEHVLEERRQRIQGELEAELRAQRGAGRTRHVDPDEIDRAALLDMLGEAEGTSTENAFGWFPRGVAGDVRWYAMDVAELLAAPTAASYAIRSAESDSARKRIVQSSLMALGLLAFLLIWFVLPHGQQAPAQSAATAPLVNGVPAQVWPIQLIDMSTATGTRVLTVTATTADSWPSAPAAEPQAYWDSSVVTPLRLCVPPAMLAELEHVRLISPASWPERVYTLGATSRASADLIVEACAAADAQQPRYGVLQETVPLASNAPGMAVALGGSGQSLTVEALQLLGPDQDPGLPGGQGRVVLQLRAPADLDWAAYKPTLTLADGQQYLPSEISPTAAGAELRYLVPLPAGELALVWDVTPPGAVQSLRWRATLAPAPSRAALLRDALRVERVELHEQRPGELTVTLTIANRGAEPLTLSRDQLTLSQAAQPLALPDIPALLSPLQAGERRAISFTVTMGDLTQPATLTIAGVPFQIAR